LKATSLYKKEVICDYTSQIVSFIAKTIPNAEYKAIYFRFITYLVVAKEKLVFF